MPVNRNALIRYKTIDTCLHNRYRRWTLEDLIDACSDALYEYEGIDKGISRRTVQMDIQMMRSEKLGYNAPIVVYENKYYKYDDPDYSITDTPLSEQDLKVMSEAVEVLRQFKGFSYFSGMGDIVSRLEDHVTSAKQKTVRVIEFEKNEHLRGLGHLDTVYQSIVNKKALTIIYKSFKAHTASNYTFYPYLLKEYRNRWFVFGRYKHGLMNLALDRIEELYIDDKTPYVENDLFDPLNFFDDVVGVTKNLNQQTELIRFIVDPSNAPYVLTKPIHKSQQLIETTEDRSMIFEIEVVVNNEVLREIMSFGSSIRILVPDKLAHYMKRKFEQAVDVYNGSNE